jgi:ABC-type branched-subunit amino acid transport system ATPase component
MPGETLITASGLWCEFGGVVALRDVDIELRTGEILALIGPNGAGKTTLLNLLSCILAPTRGEIRLRGVRTDRCRPHTIARAGVTRTFQNLQLFSTLTAAENVRVALEARHGRAVDRAEAVRWLARVGLADRADDRAEELAFGQRRLLELARALALEPAVLLLDEPAAGLALVERVALRQLLLRMRADGVTILLVEHDLDLALGVADRVVVLDQGVKIADLKPEEVRRDHRVIAAYLGVE